MSNGSCIRRFYCHERNQYCEVMNVINTAKDEEASYSALRQISGNIVRSTFSAWFFRNSLFDDSPVSRPAEHVRPVGPLPYANRVGPAIEAPVWNSAPVRDLSPLIRHFPSITTSRAFNFFLLVRVRILFENQNLDMTTIRYSGSIPVK